MPEAPSQPSSVQPKRGRGRGLVVLGVLALLGLAVGLAQSALVTAATRAVRSRDLIRADQWAKSAERFPWTTQRLLLTAAQAGDLAVIEPKIGQLLVTRNDEAGEICEAYVIGCLLNYRFSEANALLDAWQSDQQSDALPHYFRGRILEHRNDYEKAEAEYREALRLQPRHAAAAFNLGRVLGTLQRPQEALDAYRRCLDLVVFPQPVWIALARSERQLGHSDAAREWLRKAMDEDDGLTSTEAWTFLGEPSDIAGSLAPLELGQIELDSQNFPEAARWLKKALDVNPRDWKTRHAYASAVRGCGDLEEARKQFEIVEAEKKAWTEIDRLFDKLQKSPNSAELRFQMGQAFLAHYSEKQGVVWLESALYFDPNHGGVHRALADYYESHRGDDPQFERLAAEHRLKASPEPASAGDTKP